MVQEEQHAMGMKIGDRVICLKYPCMEGLIVAVGKHSDWVVQWEPITEEQMLWVNSEGRNFLVEVDGSWCGETRNDSIQLCRMEAA